MCLGVKEKSLEPKGHSFQTIPEQQSSRECLLYTDDGKFEIKAEGKKEKGHERHY
jgi:hypothetical protein